MPEELNNEFGMSEVEKEKWIKVGYVKGYHDGDAIGYADGKTEGLAEGFQRGYQLGQIEKTNYSIQSIPAIMADDIEEILILTGF